MLCDAYMLAHDAREEGHLWQVSLHLSDEVLAYNTASGQMFGRLNEFQNSVFAEANRELYLYTPSKTKKLQIENVFVCESTNDIFQKQWNGPEGQIVTLATCIGYEVTPERLVVNCMVIDERAAF